MKIRNRWICALLMLLLLVCAVPLAASAEEFTIVDTYSHYGTYAVQVGEEITFSMEPAEPELNDGTTHVTKYWIDAVDWKGYKDGYLKTVTDKDTYYRTFLGAPVFTMKFDKPGIYNVCLDNQTFDDTVGYQIWKWTYLHIIVWDYDETTYVENGHDLKVLIDDIPADKDYDVARWTRAEIFDQTYQTHGTGTLFSFDESVVFPKYFQLTSSYSRCDAIIPEGVTVVANTPHAIHCGDLTVNGVLEGFQISCDNLVVNGTYVNSAILQCQYGNITVNGAFENNGSVTCGGDLTINGTFDDFANYWGQGSSIDCEGDLTVSGTLNTYRYIRYEGNLTVTGQINMYEGSKLDIYPQGIGTEITGIELDKIVVCDPSAVVKCHFPYNRADDFMDGFAGLKAAAQIAAKHSDFKFEFVCKSPDADSLKMTSDLVIPANMTAEAWGTLDIPDGTTLTNNGTIGFGFFLGTIEVGGKLINNGWIQSPSAYRTSAWCNFQEGSVYAGSGSFGVTKNKNVTDDVWTNYITGLDMKQYQAIVSDTENGWSVQIKEISEIASGSCGENVSWTLMETGVLTISGEGPMADCTETSPSWYAYRKSITSVVIEDGVTTVGTYAFYATDFYAIEEIHLPSSITEIKAGAFAYCHGLTEVTLPDNLTEIGVSAFYYCSKLKSVTMPDTVTTIGTQAFIYCYSLAEVDFSNNLTEIGNHAFYECRAMQSISLPNKVKTIGNWAFYNCDGVTEVTIPASVTTIGECAFLECDNLTAFAVKAKNTAFCNDSKGVLYSKDMTRLFQAPCAIAGSYAIPAGVVTIDTNAFWNCDALTNVSIPASVTNIGMAAFGSGDVLNGITVDSANPNFCSDAGFLFDKNKTVLLQAPTTYQGSYTVPASVTTIGSSSFEVCAGLTEIVFPANLKAIQDYAFWRCTSLKKITFQGDAPVIGTDVFEEVTATCYYPEGNQTWTDEVMQNYADTLTWEASTSKIDCESAGHNWKAATCTDAKTCKVCGKTSGKALGHDLGAWKTTVKPTTSQSGRETRECERNGCDFSEHRSLGKKPAKPVVKAANVDSSGKIKISWGKVGGAEEYVVYRATFQNGSYKKLTVTSGISYTDKSAAAGKTYFYKVCAVSKTGVVSSYSSVVSKTCKLATPTLTVTHKQAVSQNVIQWTKVAGAAKYEVQVSVNGGTYKTLTTTSKLTYTHKNVVGGNVYRYRVIAKSATAQSAYSAVKTVTAMCPAPGGVKVALVAKKPVISWNTVSGAKKYQVYVSTSKTGKYTLLKTVTTKKLSHKAAAKGKTYFYKVRAVDAKGVAGAFSAVKSIRVK